MEKNVLDRLVVGEWVEEEACLGGKGLLFLEFHFAPASVAPVLNRVCIHSIHLFLLGNPVGLDVSD